MNSILPGAVIGVLGSGQLGRMFAIAARRLGYRVHVFSPESETPAGEIADREWTAEYDDIETLSRFAREVDVVTLEFENISSTAIAAVEKFVPVRPGQLVLETAQNRIREKQTLQRIGLPTAPFVVLNESSTSTSLEEALSTLGGNAVLKTASFGYDGKGQRKIHSGDDLADVWQEFAGDNAVLEGFIEFQRELSVIAVRGLNGDIRCYDPIVNSHANHILDISVSPATSLGRRVFEEAEEIARTVMESLNVIGVLCVEMFHTQQDRLLVNEIAPRPHNSGHLTIDAHDCCQFQQQVRSVCGLPLGSVRQRQPAAMANLLGDLWTESQAPDWTAVLRHPEVSLHLYGKREARVGRKMGHLTCLSDTAESAETLVRSARRELIS